VRTVSYGWALVAAVCLAAAAELAAPVVPALLLVPMLALLLAQVPVPARRRGAPLTQRPPRSELDRHLESLVRRRSRGPRRS
jgi:hypothetical protein